VVDKWVASSQSGDEVPRPADLGHWAVWHLEASATRCRNARSDVQEGHQDQDLPAWSWLATPPRRCNGV